MTRIPALVLLTLTLASCGGGGSTDTGRASPPPPGGYDWTALASTLDSFVAPSGPMAGYSFLLFNGGGVLFQRAGGDQTQDSVEPLASSTKLASVAAILTLVDAGLLDLDRPVGNYFHLGTVLWPIDKAAITTRMLLNHTSGLPGLQDSGQPACLNLQTGMTLQQCAQNIADSTLAHSPGSAYDYGAGGYQVAGYLATVLSGKDWHSFFAGAVATPLGLHTFTYGDPARVTNPRIAGGASSDAADYARLLAMVLHGGTLDGVHVLSAGVVGQMESNQIAGVTVAYSPMDTAQYPGYSFGLFASSPSLYPGSPGPEFSDPGLLGTIPWLDLGLGYGAVILTNTNTDAGLSVWNAVRPKIIEQLVR